MPSRAEVKIVEDIEERLKSFILAAEKLPEKVEQGQPLGPDDEEGEEEEKVKAEDDSDSSDAKEQMDDENLPIFRDKKGKILSIKNTRELLGFSPPTVGSSRSRKELERDRRLQLEERDARRGLEPTRYSERLRTQKKQSKD
jgi:hypothetical protein